MSNRAMAAFMVCALLVSGIIISAIVVASEDSNENATETEWTKERIDEALVEMRKLNYTTESLEREPKPVKGFEATKLNGEWLEGGHVEILKWEGDDMVIVIPGFSTSLDPNKRNNSITIIGKDGIIAQYDTGEWWTGDVTLLDDRIMFLARIKGKPQSGVIEIGYDGEFLWGMNFDGMSHQAELLPNGNYLIPHSKGDRFAELTREGKVVFEWRAIDGLPQWDATNFTGLEIVPHDSMTNMLHDYRQPFTGKWDWEWTHINSVQKTEDGYVAGLRNMSMIIKVGFDGEIKWTFGPMMIKSQHHPRELENGNLLVFDNGNGRVVEISRLGEVIWEYPVLAPVFGWIEKLPNGNYLFPDCFNGMVYEVDPNRNVVKQIKTGLVYQAKAYMEVPKGLQ